MDALSCSDAAATEFTEAAASPAAAPTMAARMSVSLAVPDIDRAVASNSVEAEDSRDVIPPTCFSNVFTRPESADARASLLARPASSTIASRLLCIRASLNTWTASAICPISSRRPLNGTS